MILCCGEALIDMIETRRADGGSNFEAHAGGAVFNTAIALGRLRAPAGFLSGLSSDLFGGVLQQALADSHVDTSNSIISDRPTTLAFVRLTDGNATYTFYDEGTAGRMLDPEDLPDLSPDVTACYFGGISLISEPCADFYAALARREAETRVIMVDPNIRPTFIKDLERYRARLASILEVADIVKVSDEDLHWIVQGTDSIADKARALLEAGPRIVVLTRGSEGATAYFADGREAHATSRKVEVVDTVGAGDTFNAGLLASLAEQGVLGKEKLETLDPETVEKALAHGAVVAGVTVSRAGANPPWAHELPKSG
ncbi:carbohydrate kinase [Sulfitobacter sp. D35]|uniref:carbohydrate kinase family protein n=1 Tax=Sulfitobacter sp. D35 TaxID=3083252 RepID=UPI00296E8149|nr:carbohydrate kinase [Sulfitobacter sp. D35]MDW4498945.1 carbohydrate kinase [Sulfitobacter sp. D35]